MRYKILLVAFTFCSIWMSCSSPSDTTVTIGASMTGTVLSWNQDSTYFYADKSGVSVAILGTSFRTSTDTAGVWKLSGMPPGIYTFVLTKPGFDTTVVTGQKFSGAGVTFFDPFYINATSKAVLTVDSVYLDRWPGQPVRDSILIVVGSLTGLLDRPNLNLQFSATYPPDSAWKPMYEYRTDWSGTRYTMIAEAGYLRTGDSTHSQYTSPSFYFRSIRAGDNTGTRNPLVSNVKRLDVH